MNLYDCGYFYAPYPDLPIPDYSKPKYNPKEVLNPWLRRWLERIYDAAKRSLDEVRDT